MPMQALHTPMPANRIGTQFHIGHTGDVETFFRCFLTRDQIDHLLLVANEALQARPLVQILKPADLAGQEEFPGFRLVVCFFAAPVVIDTLDADLFAACAGEIVAYLAVHDFMVAFQRADVITFLLTDNRDRLLLRVHGIERHNAAT